jgi:hypothetical protein
VTLLALPHGLADLPAAIAMRVRRGGDECRLSTQPCDRKNRLIFIATKGEIAPIGKAADDTAASANATRTILTSLCETVTSPAILALAFACENNESRHFTSIFTEIADCRRNVADWYGGGMCCRTNETADRRRSG